MVSFDIKSLFTNIPITETVQICVEADKQHLIPNNLTTPEFKSLLEKATKESVFNFNNQLYKQLDRIAVGSPLSPTLADAFICFHEEKWIENCPSEFKLTEDI